MIKFIFLFVFFVGIPISQEKAVIKKKVITLNFENCFLDNPTSYNYIKIQIPKKKKLIKRVEEGLCEYRITYKDSCILYVSSDIYLGSSLNYHNTYNDLKTRGYSDTLKNEGIQKNGLHWLQYILGDIVVGYVNVPNEYKEEFDKMVNSIERIE